MNKKIIAIASLIAVSTSFFASIGVGEAAAKKQVRSAVKQTVISTPKQTVDYSYLKKHTSFSDEQIKDFFNKGFNKEDIKNLYVLKFMSKENFDNIVTEYKNNKDIDTVLRNLRIDPDKFQEAYGKQYPEDEETNHGWATAKAKHF